MKFTKISLIVALAISSTFATESAISGDAKIFYGTDDAGDHDIFDKGASYGDASLSIDYSKKVNENIAINAGITGISTLGLENTLVSSTWVDHHLEDRVWIDVANITGTFGKTTAVLGRQKLDTPLAFTETWNIVENTFDAFTLVNKDIKDTTVVASAVTRANGDDFDPTTNPDGEFTNFQGGMTDLGDGIYTVGATTKLIPNATAQVWYYEANGLEDNKKVWTQVDAEVSENITVGVQYAQGSKDSQFVAGKIGFSADKLNTYLAYSEADDKGKLSFTNYGGFGGSKAYTEAWWNFGFVTAPDASTIAGGLSYDLGSVQLGAQYTSVDSGASKNDMDELTLTADTSIGGVDASLAFINTTADDDSIDGNTVQAYLTLPFSL
ncbi:MAG: hypothetical protein GXO60_05485 [Epsilonproteobacteria bacterium]|nr:hypothetical protein [Campylobacterota bacterium]